MADHIVHAGFHRTGTTWLQKHVFPSASGVVPATRSLMRPLFRNLAFEERFMRNTFMTAIEELGEGRRVLLSFEALVGSPWGPDHAERTADRLADVVPGARILLVVRDPEETRQSLYAQYVNEGGILTESAFQRSVLSSTYLDFDAAVERFEKRFDRVAVLRYEVLRNDPEGFVDRIAQFADIELAAPVGSRNENPSLSGWRLGLLRRWNRAFRRSRFNPRPYLPLPRAEYMRQIFQGP